MVHDTINFINGNVITLNVDYPFAKSVTICDGKIISIDNTQANAKNINLDGATLLPGFVDAHLHLSGIGKQLEYLNLRGFTSPQQIAEKVIEQTRKLPENKWIFGFGWDQSKWDNPGFPSAQILDDCTPNHPVYLTRVDGHSAWINYKAQEISGLNSSIIPDGGRVVNNCILIDNAMDIITDILPKPSLNDIERWLLSAVNEMPNRGITGVHDAWQCAKTVIAMKKISNNPEFPIRCYGMLGDKYTDLLNEYFQQGFFESDYYTIRSVKTLGDGALGSRGAALLEPYSDDQDNRGLLLYEKQEFENLAKKCRDAGFQLNTHAIGDRAVRETLNIYESTLNNTKNHRWRIEHSEMIADDDICRFAKLGVLPSIQPSHFISDMNWLDKRIGTHRTHQISRLKTLIDIGCQIPGGSDCPIEEGNPIFEFYAAVTRKTSNGFPENGWHPEECISRSNALKMLTTWASYGEFAEHRRGQIKLGYDADFTILSNNILTCPENEILKTEVLMTVVAGNKTFNSF
ncbi:MAG: amidohydrolase [Candidatus Marinimicrobia bacterium]|nr:amidohydrolase [Candidatus Neomarinimicrobiota bacterium]MBL7022954.1 amidohydrolase [Candidatus Neomarinimicrobiota bacterium]MBL7108772.1 amidohydrolase [Candidatus Neomarinimicrobiota bacterium]